MLVLPCKQSSFFLPQQENYIGEYMDFKAFNSAMPRHLSQQPKDQAPKLKLTDEIPDFPADCPREPDERFIDVHVEFKLHNVTAEFPTVS